MRLACAVAIGVAACGSTAWGGRFQFPVIDTLPDLANAFSGGSFSAYGSSTVTLNNFDPLANPASNRIRLEASPSNPTTPLDIRLTASATGGATLFNVTTLYSNLTLNSYPGFVVQLGTGIGKDFTPFGDGGFVTFEAPLAPPAMTYFSTAELSKDAVMFSGGSVPAQTIPAALFSIVIRDPAVGQTNFTLRQYALPEPTTAGLFAVGVALLGRRRHA